VNRALATLTLAGLAGAVAAAPDTAPAPRPVAPAAAPAPRAAAVVTVPDVQEVVVLAPGRPVRVRLTVRAEGKPLAEAFRDKLRAAFDYFDRDRDGALGPKELGHVFSDLGLRQMLQNGFYQPTPGDRPGLDRVDADKDGRVDFAEFVAYYRGSAASLFRTFPAQDENPAGAAATEALFKLMDADGDGKLTRAEVRAVEGLLASRDADEDECLSLNELLPSQFDSRRGAVEVQLARAQGAAAGQARGVAARTVFAYEPGRIPGTLTQQVIKKYDADGDFDLTPAEVGFDGGTFARLDRDGNGKLDGEELDAWRTGPADLEVSLSLAPRAADCAARVTTDREEVAARGFNLRQVEPGRAVVRTGRQPIEFWAAGSVPGYQQPPLKTQYQSLFTQAAGGKGHVVEKDLTGPNAVQFQFLRTLFEPMDADADGKLTRAEFDAYFDLQDSFRNVTLAVTPAVQTPTLFQLLDENRDGKLGVRELRTAWDRLIALEPGGGEVVTRAAILPSVSLRLTRPLERAYAAEQVQVIARGQNPNQVAVPQQGPVWFRRMDRNADGDVSRSEFLGTKAEFDAIDADGDGLVSLSEAEAHDKKARPAGEKK
jgi:Ca2+-binding EF-hand superfamily protein